MQVIVFRLLDEQFAVSTDVVKSINDMMEITKVPRAPEYIMGLINLRGNVSSLLNINLLMNLPQSDESSSIIIMNLEDEAVGIAVDEVKEVLEVEESSLEKIDDAKDKPYFRGIIKFQERIITLVDINKLIPKC
ncbi:purine-binding chemotaxis protein CheW [Hathewaya proteolytica DSM 3090]|uniref:Purine-binding chemotaxis protein CheW n=1 Tax=Hathewaya proteolytica DSM 3090 TaxID=1121331 RepID=A0A1M6LCA0_9CLOT|nr:chemotaxis protein CheW [Hathewaya proteolytica]SHJ68799.1 purine-binding chemotaxis protein CheW [Hathewaya proteolytica DSM 3090]